MRQAGAKEVEEGVRHRERTTSDPFSKKEAVIDKPEDEICSEPQLDHLSRMIGRPTRARANKVSRWDRAGARAGPPTVGGRSPKRDLDSM